MKKRVISWLLCLALCLSMLPMAALAEDVQAPEGPAPSLNEPQPEPRAKENETPAPEPAKKVQSELMTAEKLLMPLSLDESSLTFTVGEILAEQDSKDISTDGVIGVKTILRVVVRNITLEERGAIVKADGLAITVDGDSDSLEQTPTFGGSSDEYYVYSVFTPTQARHSVCVTITYNGIPVTRTRELTFTKCPHPGIKSGNTCSQCGAALVAELTAGASSSATYYETLSEALDAAQTEANSGCTVKLLADCSLLSKYELEKGTFTLDLDGHALTQTGSPMWVSGTANLTVKNNSSNAKNTGKFSLQSETATLSVTKSSKYALLMNSVSGMNVACFLGPDMGYKNANGAWANFNDLYDTAIYNVTVEEAPFITSDITVSPENAYVNRKATLSVTLSNLKPGITPTCSYFVSDSSNYQTSYEGIELDANQAFTAEFTPRVDQYYIRAWITAGEFTVVKTIKKTFNTCTHDWVNQNTGYCNRCKSQMAASVSPSALVGQRTYYETFDLAMNAAWDMLKTSDCWFTMFENANVGGALNNEYVTGGHTLYMVMNGKTLTSSSVVFSVPKDRWKLNFRAVGDSPGGTLIGKSRDWGAIYVQSGGSLEIGSGKYTIQNTYSDTAASIVVHGSYGTYYTPGIATIYASEDSDLGNLLIMSGQVTVHGGTFKNATVSSPGGRLTVSSGRFTGNVIVNPNAWFLLAAVRHILTELSQSIVTVGQRWTAVIISI